MINEWLTINIISLINLWLCSMNLKGVQTVLSKYQVDFDKTSLAAFSPVGAEGIPLHD